MVDNGISEEMPIPQEARQQERLIPHLVREKLRQQIMQSPDKRITFAKFMDTSLYDNDSGYYAIGRVEINADYDNPGDFTTAPERHPAFGATMANAMYEMWQKMDRPETFHIVEEGAGNGTLAHDVLQKIEQAYPDFYQCAKYLIIEKSKGLIKRQRAKLSSMPVSWINGSASQTPLQNIEGVFISNELPDAFPVHRLIRRQGVVKEIYIELDSMENFVEVEGDISPEVDDPIYTDTVLEGREMTACPALVAWQESISKALKRGYVLTVDYFADELNQNAFVPRTFYFDPWGEFPRVDKITKAYENPGEVDITTSVNATFLDTVGKKVGLDVIENSLQNDFLKKHGLEDEIIRLNAALTSTANGNTFARRADYLRRTGKPSRTGQPSFAVVLQSKNVQNPELIGV